MTKKQFFITLLLAIVLSVALELLVGNYLSARLSTWPPLRRFKVFNPQAPIVITNKEVVRLSDTQDTVDAVNRVKSRLASVAVVTPANRLMVMGSAINLTADGYFMSAQGAFATKGATYFVILNNGQSAPITTLYTDPVSTMIIFRANLGGLSVANFASSKDLVPGQKLMFITNGTINFAARFQETYLTITQNDAGGRLQSSDRPTSRTYGVQAVGALLPGEAVATLSGDIAGLWDGSSLISSDVLQATTNLFFSNLSQFRRPLFGFNYRMVSAAEANVLNIPQGAVVSKTDAGGPGVVTGSPAQAAGLQEGDTIIQWDGTAVNERQPLEELLERTKPGEQVNVVVVRDKKQVNLTITAQ